MQNTDNLNHFKGKATNKSLSTVLPDGLLVDRNWLKLKGFKRPLVDYYCRTGKLEAVARGVYRRPGPPLKWQHVVYSLQEMGFAVHVGGRSALDHQGLAHYLPMGCETVHLYSQRKLPSWLKKLTVNASFETHYHTLLSEQAETLGYNTQPFGAWDWPLNYSTRERAFLEYLDSLSHNSLFDMADKYMQGATTLRPKLVMSLLLACKKIKTKRLFLWLADRHNYAWFKYIDITKIELGRGKRMIGKGGVLNTKFNITVPRELEQQDYWDGINTKQKSGDKMDFIVEKYRNQILTLAKQNGVRNVRVFGSMARNDANPDSDLDLMVDIEKGKSGLALGGFLADVSNLIHRKVDVVTENSLHPKIKDKVLHEARVL